MVFAPINRAINIEWTILKHCSTEKEDFGAASLWLFLTACDDTMPLEYQIEDNVLHMSLAPGLKAGVYGLKAIWVKNDTCQKRSVAIKSELLNISASNEDLGKPVRIKIKSQVATYGYDGLSAYELARMRGLTELSEREWLENYIDNASAHGSFYVKGYKLKDLFSGHYGTAPVGLYELLRGDAVTPRYEYLQIHMKWDEGYIPLCYIDNPANEPHFTFVQDDKLYEFRLYTVGDNNYRTELIKLGERIVTYWED